ncbi:hypothetical protein BRIN106911_18360 [Brevibacillus invocatus]
MAWMLLVLAGLEVCRDRVGGNYRVGVCLV